MCKRKPYPRCSNHARRKLAQAISKGNKEEIRQAKEEFMITPAGIKLAEEQGRSELAQRLRKDRAKLIMRARYISQQEEVEDKFHSSHIMEPLNEKSAQQFMEDLEHNRNVEQDAFQFYKDTIKENTKKYGIPLVARTRLVFKDVDRGMVIKVPFTGEGEMANYAEARAYRNYVEDSENYIPVAKCNMAGSGDIYVLEMEQVAPVKNPYSPEYPDWVSLVDCGQVGHDKNGELVAYDL